MTLDEAVRTIRRQQKDKGAWEEFYLQIFPKLRVYVASLFSTFRVDPASSVEDVVHEALVTFLNRWSELKDKIDSGQTAVAYLKASCRNRLVDQYRHHRSATQLMDFLTLRFREAYETETGIHKSLFLKEIITLLPLECGQLLTEYVADDLTLAEIAEKKDIEPAALYARWYRCIQRAKEVLLQRKASPKRS